MDRKAAEGEIRPPVSRLRDDAVDLGKVRRVIHVDKVPTGKNRPGDNDARRHQRGDRQRVRAAGCRRG